MTVGVNSYRQLWLEPLIILTLGSIWSKPPPIFWHSCDFFLLVNWRFFTCDLTIEMRFFGRKVTLQLCSKASAGYKGQGGDCPQTSEQRLPYNVKKQKILCKINFTQKFSCKPVIILTTYDLSQIDRSLKAGSLGPQQWSIYVDGDAHACIPNRPRYFLATTA